MKQQSRPQMQPQIRPLMDSLESRTFLSGTPASLGLGHGIPPLPKNAGPDATADYATLKNDLTTLGKDASKLATATKTLNKDIAALLKSPSTALTAAQTQLKNDKAAAKTALAPDQAAVAAVYKADDVAIDTDLKNIAKDHKTKNTAQLKLDEAQLKKDEGTLHTALKAPEAALQALQKTWNTTISNDQKAVTTAIDTDPSVAPALAAVKADEAQLKTDTTTFNKDLAQYKKDLKNKA
jgi:hypothetical protein